MKNKLHNLQQRSLVLIVLTLLAFAPGMKGWGQTLLLNENFDYTAGTLLTANGWTAHSGTSNFITVAASSITYPGYLSSGIGNEVTLTTTGEDDNKAFTSQNSGTLYGSFIVNVTSSQTTGDYFAHFAAQSGSTVTQGFVGKVWIKKESATSTNFAFGLSKSTTAANVSYTGFTYVPGTTYLVVVKYNFISGPTNDNAALFINPVLNEIEPTPTILTLATDDATADPAQELSYCLRQGTAANAPALKLDGIRVATTWEDIVGAAAGNTIPTLTTQAVSSILSITATGNGTITLTGGVDPTARGFCWDLATNADPDINDFIAEETGTFTTGSFSGSMTGLTPGTQYKVRAYATNTVGTGYGNVVTFYTLSSEPTNHAGSFTASAISQTQIDLAFSAASTITNAAGYLILQKTNSAPTGAPVDATGYAVGNTIGDGTIAAIVTNPADIAASIAGLLPGIHYFFTLFPYNWDGSNAATYNYKTDGSVPVTDATTIAPLDQTSEVSGPALGSQPNPVSLSSLVTTDAAAVRVFDMNIIDYGADGQPTKITQVTIKAGTNNSANWVNTIQGIKLSIDGGTSFVTIGTPTITASSIVVPITSGNLDIPNGETKTLSLYVYLKSSGLTDNQILEFKVDAAASSHGFVADATASTFIATFSAAPVSNPISIEIVATKLKYVQQPTNTLINTIMAPAVTIEATDANNNRDLDQTGTVDLVSSGTMTGPVTAALSNGFGTFGDIVHTAFGTGLTLTASLTGLSDAVSNTFTVFLTPYLTELVVPKYMGCKTAATTNNARTSVAFCIKIDDLLPNTSYDLKFALGLTTDLPTSFGAGNVWKPVDGYAGTNTSTIPNAFMTNGTGSSGPVWVIFQPTGNGTRFDAGQVHNLRIGYAINGTSMSFSPNFVGTKTITALDIANTARTPATTDDGAFIKGSADPSTTGKYVLLFDNIAGTGDPLFSYQIRQATATSFHQSELPNPIDSVYLQSGSSAIGDYPAVIPIGANNPNGVQRVEGRNADNTISGYNTDADGIWPSGVNTTALARRDVGIITVTDAPLVVVTKTLNLKLYLEGLYNTVTGLMKQAQGLSGPQFGTDIADQVTVELHEISPPYAISALYPPFTNADLKTDGTVTINTIPGSITGSYYVVIKHRNSIETWSSAPVSFTGAGPFTYDFTTAVTQAFGNDPINDPSMKLMGGVYAIWGGNANQDGIDDGSDMLLIDNASLPPGLLGYNPEDLNGDGIVDGTDMALIDNNSKPPARHVQKP